jgi:hypothetical protein
MVQIQPGESKFTKSEHSTKHYLWGSVRILFLYLLRNANNYAIILVELLTAPSEEENNDD